MAAPDVIEPAIKTADILLVYGPLGVMTLLSMVVAVWKDRQLTKERESHTKAMRALEERYVAKTESFVTKYEDLAVAQDQTIKALRELVASQMRGA